MKTKNILKTFLGIAFLFLAFAPLVSANTISVLTFADNSSAISKTVNQGDSFSVVLVATAFGETFSNEKLERIGNGPTQIIFQESAPGIDQGGYYTYSNTINVNTASFNPGTYTLKFTAQGTQTSSYDTLTLIVNPVDTVPPVITILGNNPETVILNNMYTDAGATAWDNVDGNLTSQIIVVNGVDTTIAGTYTVNYSVSDSAGNSATATRNVTVLPTSDINPPTIIITSPTAITYTTAVTNITYIPTDAEGNLKQCWYSLDGGVTNSTAVTCVDGTSNLFSGLIPQQGTNTWTVYANDIAGNLGNTSVTFTVNDLIAPTITANLNFWSALLKLDDDEEYTVIYTATDLMGNTASLKIKFKIDEKKSNNGNTEDPTSFGTENNTGITISPSINLNEEESGLSWWQRFINWLARLFGLEEVY